MDFSTDEHNISAAYLHEIADAPTRKKQISVRRSNGTVGFISANRVLNNTIHREILQQRSHASQYDHHTINHSTTDMADGNDPVMTIIGDSNSDTKAEDDDDKNADNDIRSDIESNTTSWDPNVPWYKQVDSNTNDHYSSFGAILWVAISQRHMKYGIKSVIISAILQSHCCQ